MIPVSAWKCEWCGQLAEYQHDRSHGDDCVYAPRMRSRMSCVGYTELLGNRYPAHQGIKYCRRIDEIIESPMVHCMQHQLTEGYEKHAE